MSIENKIMDFVENTGDFSEEHIKTFCAENEIPQEELLKITLDLFSAMVYDFLGVKALDKTPNEHNCNCDNVSDCCGGDIGC